MHSIVQSYVGMLLSVYDMGLRQVTIYGPEGLGKYIASLQLFIFRFNSFAIIIFRKDYQITVVELEDDIPSIDLNNGCFICPFVIKEHESIHSISLLMIS